MIKYNKHSIDQKDINAVIKSLKSEFIAQGPLSLEFEKQLSKKFGSSHCTVVSNGTSALHISLIALNLNKEDIVLVSPITFVASAFAPIYSGLKIDFVDIDMVNFAISVESLEKKIIELKSKNKKVSCLIVTDYSGIPANWKEINLLKKKYNFKIINDNCHAIGSIYNNSNKYAVKYADIAVHSYHAIKNITSCEGGSILTNNLKIDKVVKNLRTHGSVKNNFLTKNNGIWFYDISALGYNYRLSEIQCALGISQLTKLDKFLKKRKKIAEIYDKKFKNITNIKTPQYEKNKISSYHIYPLLINFNQLKINKKSFFIKLKNLGYTLQVNYIPIYKFSFFKNKFNYKYLKYAELFYNQQVSLPCYYDLKLSDANKIADLIIKIIINHGK